MTDWRGAAELLGRTERLLAGNPRPRKGWWNWQPLPLAEFYAGMDVVRESLGAGRHRFLDVGSGIGSKLVLAAALGFDPEGVEHEGQYVKASRRLCPDMPVHQGDARRFTEYGRFDVVYCYRLARDHDVQAKLNAHIIRRMRNGALLFCPGEPFPDGEPVGGRVWQVQR